MKFMTVIASGKSGVFDIDEAFRQERLADLRGARVLAAAAAVSDIENFLQAVDFLDNFTIDGWRLGMRRVARLTGPLSDDFREAFLSLWVQRKTLPRKVGERAVMAKALRVLLPRTYSGSALRLYRGTTATERKRRLYGFSWTTDIAIAESFARTWHDAGLSAVVLETVAPADAIFVLRQDVEFYDEREAVVDPFRLTAVWVAARL
jgi:hypothetical protein